MEELLLLLLLLLKPSVTVEMSSKNFFADSTNLSLQKCLYNSPVNSSLLNWFEDLDDTKFPIDWIVLDISFNVRAVFSSCGEEGWISGLLHQVKDYMFDGSAVCKNVNLEDLKLQPPNILQTVYSPMAHSPDRTA